jgi:xylan 1,4-beta-xylosidase
VAVNRGMKDPGLGALADKKARFETADAPDFRREMAASTIRNPVLRGFHPDPSILRVGEDYYIATSTFEWFPGVEIHHSRDLIHWKLIARPLRRVSQLAMDGIPNSGGVWAPCLSHDGHLFHLCYTNVRTLNIPHLETPNYLVTAPDIDGEWSEPVALNASGFDPSLFHDDDGRKWLVNMLWNSQSPENPFSGIVLQEYSSEQKKLVGEPELIFKGTALGVTEGPHIYKHNGFYYLMAAEGGTSYFHAVTMARSRSISGPYEVDPENPILTSKDSPELEIQKAGHASLVETQGGEWYLAHLCGRPLSTRGRCILGRETCLQKVRWTKAGWLRLEGEAKEPKVLVPAPRLEEQPWEPEPARDDFDSDGLSPHFQTLRMPLGEETATLTERPGFLRLKGAESLGSRHRQAFVARRQQAFCCTATTCVEFEPDSNRQAAGLVCFYDTDHYYYLRITRDARGGKCLGVIACDKGNIRRQLERDLMIEGWRQCFLKAQIRRDELQFFYSRDGLEWLPIGPVLDASKLSDEYCHPVLAFTGAFVGLCAQDLSGKSRNADFDFFEYTEEDPDR